METGASKIRRECNVLQVLCEIKTFRGYFGKFNDLSLVQESKLQDQITSPPGRGLNSILTTLHSIQIPFCEALKGG